MINMKNSYPLRYIFAIIFAATIYLVLPVKSILAQKKIPDNFCITFEEQLLFDKLNILIEDYGKSSIDLSASLSFVAKTHVNDLLLHHPDTSVCNLSSWSDKGEWTACCHNPYVPQQDCMWDKPKELTPYTYRGYELASYFEESFTVDSVINLWSETKEVLDMLLTEGNYKKKKWICMGIAMNEHYVSVWFGQRADRLDEPDICNGEEMAVTNDTMIATTPTGEIIYYLIFGSFTVPKDAKEAVKRYKKNGFENAGTLKSGKQTRVFLGQYSSLKEAMHAKQQLAYTYREAWIYKE